MLEEVKGRRRFTWILLSQNAHVAEIRDGVLMLAMAGVGARDSFAKGGSQDVLREALIEVLGVDLRIETMVDPSVGGAAPQRTGAPPAPTGPVTRTRAIPPPSRSTPVAEPPGSPRKRVSRRASRCVPPAGGKSCSSGSEVDERDAVAHPDDSEVDAGDESAHRTARSPTRGADHRRGGTPRIGWLDIDRTPRVPANRAAAPT